MFASLPVSFIPPLFTISCLKLVASLLFIVFSFYLKAQVLAPKDGRPNNQLAVVALNAVGTPTHGLLCCPDVVLLTDCLSFSI